MRILYLLSLIYVGLALTSCATDFTSKQLTNPTKPAPSHPKKSPLTVSFYTKTQPKVPYEIIGEESISKFKLGNSKRQEAHIHDGMRELAAAMGGDAVINIKHNTSSITGTVVAYQKEVKAPNVKASI
jgi:hypothetical protein